MTFKKFGRKYTVDEADAPPPTRAAKKRNDKQRMFFARATATMAAPPKLPAENAGFVWATTGARAAAPAPAR